MYNYYTLLDNLQETLNTLKSLSVCIMVLDKNGEIIDMNKAASDLLKIKNTEDYIGRKYKLEMDNQFYKITENMQSGKKICGITFKFKCADNSSVTVNLQSDLLFGLKDVFVFQFSEICEYESVVDPKCATVSFLKNNL